MHATQGIFQQHGIARYCNAIGNQQQLQFRCPATAVGANTSVIICADPLLNSSRCTVECKNLSISLLVIDAQHNIEVLFNLDNEELRPLSFPFSLSLPLSLSFDA